MTGTWDFGQRGGRCELGELARDAGGEDVAFGATDEQAGLAQPLWWRWLRRSESWAWCWMSRAGLGQDLRVPVPPSSVRRCVGGCGAGQSCRGGVRGGAGRRRLPRPRPRELAKPSGCCSMKLTIRPPPRGWKRWATSTRTSPAAGAAGDSVRASRLAMPPSEAPITIGASRDRRDQSAHVGREVLERVGRGPRMGALAVAAQIDRDRPPTGVCEARRGRRATRVVSGHRHAA